MPFDLITIVITLIIFSSCALAFFSRMDGGGEPKTAEAVERILCISPFVILCFILSPFFGILSLAAYAGRATGHGQYFPNVFPKVQNPDNVEFVDKLVSVFFGPDPRLSIHKDVEEVRPRVEAYGLTKLHLRCAFGMALTGPLVTIVPCIIALISDHLHNLKYLAFHF